jgi:hypothetical protein
MNREQLEAALKGLDTKIVIKSDHNNSDLEIFLAYEKQKNKIEALKNENAALKDNLDKEKLLSKSQASDIETLNSDLEAAELKNKSSEFPTGTYKKKQYEVVYPKISLSGAVYTAKEISEDNELLAHLVKSNSSAIRLVSQ